MQTYPVAVIQMISGDSVPENLALARSLIAEAASQGAQLIVLPEYFPLISSIDTDKLRIREKAGEGPIQDFLRETAVRYGVWIVGGSLPLETSNPDKVSNTCLVFNSGGECVARYDKIHLFSFQHGTERYDERLTMEAGQKVVTFDSPFGRVGVSICYDLRFPELYRAMGAMGATGTTGDVAGVNLLVVPAAFIHTTGQAHWELLLRARAVENLCYVLAAAQGGQHPSGRQTYGNSMIIDPWGKIIAQMGTGNGVVLAELDAAYLGSVRESLPALQHRVLR